MAKKAKKNALLGGVHPAVISVWAALIAAAHLLPAIVLVGTGGTMSVSAILVPLAGVLFGPVAGTLVGAIGQFIGFLIAPAGAWLGMFTFLIGTCTALTTGLASRGKGPYALILSGLGIVLWMTQEIGRKVHLIANYDGFEIDPTVSDAYFSAIAYLENRNLVVMRADPRGLRVLALPDLGWETGPGDPNAFEEPQPSSDNRDLFAVG